MLCILKCLKCFNLENCIRVGLIRSIKKWGVFRNFQNENQGETSCEVINDEWRGAHSQPGFSFIPKHFSGVK